LTDGEEKPAKRARRTFSSEEKQAIVTETERPGETVTSVARRHDIVTSMVFRWRAEMGLGKRERARLAAVRLAGASSSEPLVLHDLVPPSDGMAAVDLGDGRRVFAPIGSDPEAVRRQVAKQENAR
jgi:transposase-like protein